MPHSGHSSCQVRGMYHFDYLDVAARKSHSFYFLNFNISFPNPIVSYPSTRAHSFDIRIPVVAQHSLFKPPMPVFTSDFYVVVATSLSLDVRCPISGEEKLGILRQLPRCDGMRAMGILISGISREDGWMDGYGRSSRAPSCSHQGRCLVEEESYCYGLWHALPTCVAYLHCQLLTTSILMLILDIHLKPVSATTGSEHLEIQKRLQIQVRSPFKIIARSFDVTNGVPNTVEAGLDEEFDRPEGS